MARKPACQPVGLTPATFVIIWKRASNVSGRAHANRFAPPARLPPERCEAPREAPGRVAGDEKRFIFATLKPLDTIEGRGAKNLSLLQEIRAPRTRRRQRCGSNQVPPARAPPPPPPPPNCSPARTPPCLFVSLILQVATLALNKLTGRRPSKELEHLRKPSLAWPGPGNADV